jgi:hypothetical protein
MNPVVQIPFVIRPDLLNRALSTIPRDLPVELRISSPIGYPIPELVRQENILISEGRTEPFSQTMVYFQQRAVARNAGCWLFMHSDGFAQPEDFERIIAMAEDLTAKGEKWGIIFTHYDVLACFNTAAIEDIGGWDQVFAMYFFDNHNYRRLQLAGYKFYQLENHSVIHGDGVNGSHTINSDVHRRRRNEITFPAYVQLYREMWGGTPGEETKKVPWE